MLAAVALCPPLAATAQAWPAKPVRIVVPFPPGGNVDTTARIVATALQRDLGQTVIVENKPGAGGLIAGDLVAKAEPDGYTLFMAANGPLLYAPTIFNRPLYQWNRSFAPVGMVSLTPLLIHVHPSLPARTVPELIALAKARPDGLTMASPGAGTTNHLLSEMLQRRAGVRWLTVHYRGNAPALTDLLGGQVQFSVDQVSVAQGAVKDGRTRALGVIAPRRVPWLPDVPTLAEQGVEGVDGQTFTGLLAPAGTPPAVVERLSAALKVALADKEVMQRIDHAGAEPRWTSSLAFAEYLAKEESIWLPIIKAAGIKAE